jgi:3-phosphoshikimate 1-carboxyvinyltransferase
MRISKPSQSPDFFELSLPSSKSISNRVLIIQELCDASIDLLNISQANDTVLMQNILKSKSLTWNVEDAGTAMRFLTSLAAILPGIRNIYGTDRMHDRPIRDLVDALRILGAKIEYLGREGYPPLKIEGGNLKHAKVKIPGNISSQFISSILLISPYVKGGVTLEIVDEQVSLPYIEMTILLMEHFGIDVERKGSEIVVKQQLYKAVHYKVEADWSSASYWFNMAVLFPNTHFRLNNLKRESIQGDAQIVNYYKSFNLNCTDVDNGIELICQSLNFPKESNFDLNSTPDLAQTIITLMVNLQIEGQFEGIEHLRFKETDRISALQNEIAKLGFDLKKSKGAYKLMKSGKKKWSEYRFDVYKDHRMAMSFALLAALGDVELNAVSSVVNKSYPTFFSELERFGFKIEY